FFYIVFYKPDQTSGYKLYSPYMDGPEKLVTTDPGSRASSLNVLQRQLGDEVARTVLSLLPDEPVDLQTARASLQSDVMLSAIKTLPDQPINKDRLNQRRQILESVTHRVLLGNEFLDVLTVPLQDPDGTVNLHYALRLRRPEDFAIAQAKGDRYYYAIEVTTRVLTPDHKPIFTQTDSLSRYLSDSEFDRMKNRAFAYEGILPLPPGKYDLEFTLTNKVKQTAFRAQRQVAVPAPPAAGMFMTEPVAFSAVEPIGRLQQGQVPFAVAGVRFQPEVGPHADLVAGQDLQVFYQLWQPPSDPQDQAGKKLVVEYGYGRPGMAGDSKTLREDVSRDQFDRSGSLLTGKKIPVSTLPVGNYRLAITVTDPEANRKIFGSLAFRISRQGAVPTWYVYDPHLADSVLKGVADYHRALCYRAAGDNANAEHWLKLALQKDPHNPQFTSALVGVYFDRHAYPAIADLYARGSVDATNDEVTVLRTAESLDRGGQTRKAVALLESALAVNTQSGPLNLALANLYKRSGDLRKAEESERKAKVLMASP
ncbi:MAG: tetratricopeptide repeat protein, partial [Rudaea sp.]